MSEVHIDFTISQINANLTVDPAPNVTMSIPDPLVANFYIEGTTGSSGTVTQVGGAGSGLGFSLGGNVTSTGNLTLTTPTDTALRTTLNIGNVANINLNGNTTNYLNGTGAWSNVAQIRTDLNIGNVANINLNANGSQVLAGNGSWITPSTSSGTVTNVATSGSGLGFSLSGGPITNTGTVTLTTPTDTALRTSLNIGNVANINLNANGSQVLAGNGTWVAQTGGGASYNGTAITANSAIVTSAGYEYITPTYIPGTISSGMVFRAVITGRVVNPDASSNIVLGVALGDSLPVSWNVSLVNASTCITPNAYFGAVIDITFRDGLASVSSMNIWDSTLQNKGSVQINGSLPGTPIYMGILATVTPQSTAVGTFRIVQAYITRML